MYDFFRLASLQTLLLCASLTGMVAASGCDEPDIAVYSTPKETPPRVMTPSTQAPQAQSAPSASVTPPAWQTPAGWVAVENQNALRVATFSAGEGNDAIEIIVSQFPGDVGGLLANVNRWRQQIGAAPLTAEQLPREVTPFNNGDFEGHLMRIRGPELHVLAASIHDRAADRTWFVKATAPPSIADQHEQAVFAFSRSFGASETGEANHQGSGNENGDQAGE